MNLLQEQSTRSTKSVLTRKTKDRTSVLENRDGEMWRKVVGYVATAVIGIVVGFIFTQIGM